MKKVKFFLFAAFFNLAALIVIVVIATVGSPGLSATAQPLLHPQAPEDWRVLMQIELLTLVLAAISAELTSKDE